MPLSYVDGDILADPYTVIGHLADCVSSHAKGFTSVLFQKFPHADCYTSRSDGRRDEPGKLIGCGDGKEERLVLHLLAQYYPGPSKWDRDSLEKRLGWFCDCLAQLASWGIFQYPQTTLAFPFGMGGAELWPQYEMELQRLSNTLPCSITIVKWNCPK